MIYLKEKHICKKREVKRTTHGSLGLPEVRGIASKEPLTEHGYCFLCMTLNDF